MRFVASSYAFQIHQIYVALPVVVGADVPPTAFSALPVFAAPSPPLQHPSTRRLSPKESKPFQLVFASPVLFVCIWMTYSNHVLECIANKMYCTACHTHTRRLNFVAREHLERMSRPVDSRFIQ